MKAEVIDNTLILYLEGRIDTANSPQVEKEVMEVVAENPGKELVVDAGELNFISSSGLRILMKLIKETGKKFTVRNVSTEVYEIFEVTGFTEMLDIRKAVRQLSVEGCEIIGRGSFGIVYRIDPETIVKVYREGVSLEQLQEEKRYATAAFVHGIPTAIAYDTVQVGSCYGNVYELLNAVTVGKAVTADPSRAEELGRKMGRLFLQVHETEMEPGVLPKISDKFRARIDYLEQNHLSHEDAELMRRVVDAIPETNTLVHGDFHEGNVMVQDGELLLIDLDSVCVGNPIYDFMSNYGLRKICANGNHKIARLSLNLEPELIPVLDKYERQEFLGSEDPAVLEEYVNTMELFFPFRHLLLIALEQSNRNLTPEAVEKIKAADLPVLRKNYQLMIDRAGQW